MTQPEARSAIRLVHFVFFESRELSTLSRDDIASEAMDVENGYPIQHFWSNSKINWILIGITIKSGSLLPLRLRARR